jgi:2-desacetyl-2-hydroxyethyl bacteriochlorophyllide A dehydrogenase
MVAPGRIEFQDVPVPRCGAGEVLVRLLRIGVCGSDVHVHHGKHPFTKYPVIQGHEFSAVVEGVGENVSGIGAGMKVTATPQITCGECPPCRRGRYNVCENLKVMGFQAPGVAQEFAAIPADKIVVLPDGFTAEQGAFVEPVAVAAHATGRSGDLAGRNVVVLGAGPIGNFIAQACKARGAARVLVTDLAAYRLDVASRVGIDAVSNATSETLAEASRRVFGADGFDVAFEAVGAEVTLDQAVQAITKGGTIVVVGVYGRRPDVDMARVGEHELSVIGSMMYRREDYLQAVEWIAQGKIQTAALDSRHFAFERYADAYAYIDAHGASCVKVFIDM